MKRMLPSLAVLFALGCGPARVPSYVFSAPLPRVQEWTQIYPASRDRDELKFLLVNDATGARISFFSHPSLYRTPGSVAGEMRVRFAQDGLAPTDVIEPYPQEGTASFRIRDDRRGTAGKVAIFRPAAVRYCVVAVGTWPAENDARARADMDLIVAHIDAWPEG